MNQSNTLTSARRDLYQHVTTRILEDLERGVRPWLKPWSTSNVGHSILPRWHNGVPYQGINVLLLWGEAMTRGYAPRRSGSLDTRIRNSTVRSETRK